VPSGAVVGALTPRPRRPRAPSRARGSAPCDWAPSRARGSAPCDWAGGSPGGPAPVVVGGGLRLPVGTSARWWW